MWGRISSSLLLPMGATPSMVTKATVTHTDMFKGHQGVCMCHWLSVMNKEIHGPFLSASHGRHIVNLSCRDASS